MKIYPNNIPLFNEGDKYIRVDDPIYPNNYYIVLHVDEDDDIHWVRDDDIRGFHERKFILNNIKQGIMKYFRKNENST